MNTLLEKNSACDNPAPDGADRRRSHREPVATVGSLRLTEDQNSKEAGRRVLVNDVSLHGVGMRTSFPLEMNQVFFVEIGVGPLHLESQMRVVRVRPRTDGTWDIGGEFC